MKIWREDVETIWYVIGCEDCPEWQAMALSKEHEDNLVGEHEAAKHPDSFSARNKVSKRRRLDTTPRRRRVAPDDASLRIPELAELGSTAYGAARREFWMKRAGRETKRAARITEPKTCVDCGGQPRTALADRCESCHVEHRRNWKAIDYRKRHPKAARPNCDVCGEPLAETAHYNRRSHEGDCQAESRRRRIRPKRAGRETKRAAA